MRFGLIHRIMTDALAALGLLALVSSGEINRWISAAILAGLVLSLMIPDRLQDALWMRRFGVLAPIALLAAQAVRWFAGASLLPLSVEFAAALQVVRLATRRGAAHDQQVIVLALLHLIAGTVLGGGLAYGLCFVGFLIVTPGALVLSHLRREVEGNYRQGARDRTGLPVDVPRILRSRRVIGQRFLLFTCLLSVPIFLFTASLFIVFPRVGLSLLLLSHSRPERMIGFSDRVDLGGVGKLRSDPQIAMRIDYPGLPPEPPPRLALYLRGTAFDRYDGRSWSRSSSERAPVSHHSGQVAIRRDSKPNDRAMRIELEPIDPPVIFLPPDAVALKLLPNGPPLLGGTPTVWRGPEGEFKYLSNDERGLRYHVYLAKRNEVAGPLLAPGERARYLSLPPKTPARISDLARRWVGATRDPLTQARHIESRLRQDYKYDLESPSGAAENPLDHFLFESKRGHCEFYSTAMAVLLRSLGVPTRNVTGFIGGTYNRFGQYYAVRQGDAHSWVEVYIDGKGWLHLDPTPPANAAPTSEINGVLAFVRDLVEAATQRWNRHVVGYDLKQQVSLLQSFRSKYAKFKAKRPLAMASPKRVVLLVVGLLLITGAAYWWWRRTKASAKVAPKTGADNDAMATQAAELYRALETALAANGVPRFPSTPPLAHAQALSEIAHPLAREVLELTQIYLGVRFGDGTLSADDRREFLSRVRRLRLERPPPMRKAA